MCFLGFKIFGNISEKQKSSFRFPGLRICFSRKNIVSYFCLLETKKKLFLSPHYFSRTSPKELFEIGKTYFCLSLSHLLMLECQNIIQLTSSSLFFSAAFYA
jgi:hypothetical protein